MPQLPFRDKPLKLPPGEKLKGLSYVNLPKLETELKEQKFTGYLTADIPDHGLKAGGKGKILFIEGDIIAASFETDDEVLVRNKAVEVMFNFPNANTDLFSYDETDIWLAIEMNRSQLFQYEPEEKKEKKLSREELLAKYKLKETTDDEAEALIKRATDGE